MNVGMRPGLRTTLLVSALTLTMIGGAAADDGIAGKWRSEVVGPQGKIQQIVQFQQDNTGRWIGTTKSSVDKDKVHDLDQVTVDGNRVTFRRNEELPGGGTAKLAFDLRLRPLENKLGGTMTVTFPGGEREMPVEFTRVIERADAEGVSFDAARPVMGSWAAHPDDKDKERVIQLDVLPDAENYQGTITDTGVDATVAMRDLEVKDGNVVSFNFRFEGAPFMSSFWGRYDEVRDELRGTLSVGGRSQPLRFERTSQGPDDVQDEFTTRKAPLPIKHPSRLAATARLSWWQPLYVLKEKVRNINDITTGDLAYDGGARFYIVDYLAVQARYARGGVGFDTNETNLGLFDPVTGSQGNGLSAPLTRDSYLSLDGFEFSFVGYLGQNILPGSKFNPYLIGLVGKTKWELTESGRGSDVIQIFETPVEGSSWTFGGGLGTEYAMSDRFGLELEWLWAYTTTGDETKWNDTTYQWTNQHVYRLSLGGIVWF
ncbi:MAG: hypothetical protein R3D98_03265 [Candidatus Krumholzibacteriia bacterium]